jgi:anti-anti-sigma factor
MLERTDSPGAQRVHADLLRVAVDVEDGSVVVTLEGDLDLSVREALVTELHDALRSAAERKVAIVEVVLDRLGFCDSTGIQAFLQAHKEAVEHDIALVLAAPRDAVRRTLDIACVGDVIEITDERTA